MQRAQWRWLADTADGVLRRTEPNREPLGQADMALEAADIGEDSSATQLIERWPRLPALLALLSGMMMLGFFGLLFLAYRVLPNCYTLWHTQK